jgi:uncharacterized SAM-binding protein YcdF (DUF218 family)
MVTVEALSLAQKLWEYHHMHHVLKPSDCILVLGSHDKRVAERGAELYLQGYAPLLLFSGGLGRLTQELWRETEAELFAGIALQMGVPKEAILIENRSTNTGENILFSLQVLQEQGLDPECFLVVQKPYMERRSYATFKKHWPDKEVQVTSPQIPFEDYATEEIPMEKVINIMVGDLQRIKLYTLMSFQIYQEIPEDVWNAFERLVALGFDKQLVR